MTKINFLPSTSRRSNSGAIPSAEWLLYAGFISLAGGAMAAVTGAILLVAARLPEYHSLHGLGVALLISLLPALLLGGLALDRYEARTRLHGR